MSVTLPLAALAQTLAPPSPAQIDAAKRSLPGEAAANRAVFDKAIERRFLESGAFRIVTDKAERRLVAAGFQKRLRSIGVPATVAKCEWIGLVAEGVKNGNVSYGGACRLRIASRPPADFLICEASLGGISLIKPDWFSSDADYIQLFIRRTCL
jgi:hypothetical protein